MMGALIWGGTAVTVLGLLLLVWCILAAFRLRRGGLPEDVVRGRLQKLVAYNMGALALSTIGLMMVILGLAFA